MSMINAGDLRHQVTLLTDNSSNGDTAGKHKTTYITVGTYRALVELVSGKEVTNASQKKAVNVYKVTMRGNIGVIKATDRLLWIDYDGITRTLEIVSAKKDPFGVAYDIDADELIINQ